MTKNQILIKFSLLLLIQELGCRRSVAKDEFVRVNGVRFMLDGAPFYGNGFNAYWLMIVASYNRSKVTTAFEHAVRCHLSIGRTMAYSDGGPNPLQSSPGVYKENMFKGLDFVISEAGRFGLKLILHLVNNFDAYGGKAQYVRWARERGQHIPNDDGFYTNPMVKNFFKNHIHTVLTRVNTITHIAYKDDPTIMAWELMNEPRCPSDVSGATIHGWIAEMAPYVKSIDRNHLLEVGSEGFYGPSSRQKNPNHGLLGSDFISENQFQDIDFVAFHAYTTQWLTDPKHAIELEFLKHWVDEHIQDAQKVLRKPILLTEFGKSSRDPGYRVTQRDALLNVAYSAIYTSASTGGAAAGFLFWQQLVEGMESYRDGFEKVLSKPSTTVELITAQSRKLISHLRRNMLSRTEWRTNKSKIERTRTTI